MSFLVVVLLFCTTLAAGSPLQTNGKTLRSTIQLESNIAANSEVNEETQKNQRNDRTKRAYHEYGYGYTIPILSNGQSVQPSVYPFYYTSYGPYRSRYGYYDYPNTYYYYGY